MKIKAQKQQSFATDILYQEWIIATVVIQIQPNCYFLGKIWFEFDGISYAGSDDMWYSVGKYCWVNICSQTVLTAHKATAN